MRSGNHQVSVAFIQMVLVVQTQVYQSSARITRQQGASAPQKTRCLLNESGAAQRPPGNPWRLNPQREVLWGAGGDRRGRGEEDLTNSGPFELSGAHSPRGALGLEGKKNLLPQTFPVDAREEGAGPYALPREATGSRIPGKEWPPRRRWPLADLRASAGKSQLRVPKRLAPGPRERVEAAPDRADPAGESARRRALTSILQPVAELAALADPQLLPLLGLRRLPRRGAQQTRGGGQGSVAPGRRRDGRTRGTAAFAARGRLHGAGRRIPAATRVRSARRRGSERDDGRRDSAEEGRGGRARRSGGEPAAARRGGRGCRGAARLARRVAQAGASWSTRRSAPRGRCGRRGSAPRPQHRSSRTEIRVDRGIRQGLTPGGSGEVFGARGGTGRACRGCNGRPAPPTLREGAQRETPLGRISSALREAGGRVRARERTAP